MGLFDNNALGDGELADFREELNNKAVDIINRGNTDLLFGGSSPEEAQFFGQSALKNDAPRVGAFLGGVALANLKVQQQRDQRFNRILKLQQGLSDEQRFNRRDATTRDNAQLASRTSIANTTANNSSRELIANQADERVRDLAAEEIEARAELQESKIAGQKSLASLKGNTKGTGTGKARAGLNFADKKQNETLIFQAESQGLFEEGGAFADLLNFKDSATSDAKKAVLVEEMNRRTRLAEIQARKEELLRQKQGQ